MITFDLDTTDLTRKLDRIPDDVQRRRVLRKAVQFGATPIVRAVRQETPVGQTGNLKRSIGKKTHKINRDHELALVGPRIFGKHQGFHGHLVHDGHIAADGSLVPGDPFLVRGTLRARREALSRMISKLQEQIEEVAGR